jgi:hypothetical protein
MSPRLLDPVEHILSRAVTACHLVQKGPPGSGSQRHRDERLDQRKWYQASELPLLGSNQEFPDREETS